MPVSDSKEHRVNLFSQNSDDSITGIPIKKRPFVVARSPSPLSQTSSLPPEDCDIIQKKLKVLETKSFDSDSSAQPVQGATSVEYPLWRPKLESYVNRDLILFPQHECSTGDDRQDLGFGMTLSPSKETGDIKENDISASGLVKGNTRLLTELEGPSGQLMAEGNSDGKSILTSGSSFQSVTAITELQSALGWSYGQSRDGQGGTSTGLHPLSKEPFGLPRNGLNVDGSTVKPEKLDYYSKEPTCAGGQHDLQGKCSVDPVKHYASRLNWDLNTVMDTWEGSICDSTVKPERHKGQGVVGMYQKKHESVQTPPIQFSGCDVTLGRCNLTNNDSNLRLTSPFMPINNHDISDTGLELQLRPPRRPELHLNCGISSLYGKSGSEMPDLSLSLTSSVHVAECRATKPELHEESGLRGTTKVEIDALNLVTLKHVKSEPCEGTFQDEALKGPGHSNLKLAGLQNISPVSSRAVKSEPFQELSQEYVRRSERKSFLTDVNSLASMPCRIEASQEASESTVSTLLSNSVVSDGRKQDDVPEMSISTSRSSVVSGIVDKAPHLVSQSSILDVNSSPNCEEMLSETCILRDEHVIAAEASDLVSESLTSRGRELNAVKGKRLLASVPSDCHPRVMVSGNQEHMAANRVPDVTAEMDCLDGDKFNASECTAADELHVESYGNRLEAENDGEKADMSAKIQEGSCDNERRSDNSFHAVVAGDMASKEGGGDYDYEDGEVRDSAVHGAIEGSREQNEEKQTHDRESANDTVSVDVPMMSSDLVGKEDQVQNSAELLHDPCKVDDRSTCVQEAPTVKLLSSGKKRLTKTTHESGKDNSETKLKSSRETAKTSVKSSQDKQNDQADNAAASDLPAKFSVSSKSGSDGPRHSRIIKLNVAPKKVSCEKSKSILTRLMSSRVEGENLVDKSFRQIKQHPQGIREENCIERSRKYDTEKSREQLIRKGESNMVHIRRKVDTRLDALHRDNGSESAYLLGRRKGPPRSRSPRCRRTPEVPLDGSVGSAGSAMRMPISNELPNLSRFPIRRLSPGAREGHIPVDTQIASRHGISPGRSIGRDARDFPLLAREGKIMRSLADAMMDPRLLPHLRSGVERPENSLMQRERRSLSPVQRRVPPLHFPLSCLESSPRSRLCSPREWSPSRRLPDVFSGHRELVRCRSPPVIRLERMRTPPQHPCFAEDIVVRRHGSPLQFSRLTDNTRDIGLPMEHDFPGPGGLLPRNTQRHDPINPQGAEECFERLHYNRFRALVGGDECIDDRRHEERRGLVHPMRTRLNVGENDEDGLRYHIEDGCPRAFRNCSDIDEGLFPDRGSPRDFDGHIRNRLGNIHCRLRGMREDDHMYRGRQGWHDANSNDVRLKRRRF